MESANIHRQKRNTRRKKDNHDAVEDGLEMSPNEEKKKQRPNNLTTTARADAVSVAGEDIEEGEIPYAQVTEIVNVLFEDPTDGHFNGSKVDWEYTPDRKGMILLLNLLTNLFQVQVGTFCLLRILKLEFLFPFLLTGCEVLPPQIARREWTKILRTMKR